MSASLDEVEARQHSIYSLDSYLKGTSGERLVVVEHVPRAPLLAQSGSARPARQATEAPTHGVETALKLAEQPEKPLALAATTRHWLDDGCDPEATRGLATSLGKFCALRTSLGKFCEFSAGTIISHFEISYPVDFNTGAFESPAFRLVP